MKEYVFRPKARLVSTIGSDIIKDNYAAIIELVKNAYDADSSKVVISFDKCQDNIDKLKITIEDEGHGMSFDTLINNWLVPATDNKLIKKVSPSGRKYQGRKGIGRFATAVLGDELSLSSIQNNNLVEVFLNWKNFSNEKFLDEVTIPIIQSPITQKNGTKFEIYSKNTDEWADTNFEKLIKELRKTMTPLTKEEKDDFEIILQISPRLSTKYSGVHQIKPYPILDLFSYRVLGMVNNGLVEFAFENNIEDVEDRIEIFKTDAPHICGEIMFDLRIFDKDPERIEAIIKNETFKEDFGENAPTKSDVRELINEISGVYVYRHGFRIRPYGDDDFDWLSLDKRRVQDPSVKLGSDQMFGVINIASEEESNLIDKSARDGLKDNEAYSNFKEIMMSVITRVETARRTFRKTSGIGIKKTKNIRLSDKFSQLVSKQDVIEKINKIENISEENKRELSEIWTERESKDEKIVEEIQKEIAIYHGQATLGKIVNLIMHEASKPLGWFINNYTTMPVFLEKYKKTGDDKYLERVTEQAKTYVEYSQHLDGLFKKLDPLASRTRTSPSKVLISQCIEEALLVFSEKISKNNIKVNIETVPPKIYFYGWKIDMIMILTNIIENSVYWLDQNDPLDRKINIKAYQDEEVIIEIEDNGPGIKKEDIKSGVIFEPGISNKYGGGTGLGLPIAGEAASRNGGELKAIECPTGALIQISLPLPL